MRFLILSTVMILPVSARVNPVHHYARITTVDADKGTIEYQIVAGPNRGTEFKASISKGCVLKEGFLRAGKPAVLKEGDEIADGLKNPIFQKASVKNPLKVDIYTAGEDDPDKGIKKGDVIKIYVNPPPKKKE